MEEIKNINEMVFPDAQEGDRVLYDDGKYYTYTDGIWIEETN